MDKIRQELNLFAANHKLIFEDRGEVGFGRPCVGFISKGGGYVDYNPQKYKPTGSRMSMENVWPYDDRLCAPSDVEAYHKHDCIAVLVRNEDYDSAIKELWRWMKQLEVYGETTVALYETGAEGLQALMSGVTGYALRFIATTANR